MLEEAEGADVAVPWPQIQKEALGEVYSQDLALLPVRVKILEIYPLVFLGRYDHHL